MWEGCDRTTQSAVALMTSMKQAEEKEKLREKSFMTDAQKAFNNSSMNLHGGSQKELHFDGNASQQLNNRPGTNSLSSLQFKFNAI
jgi:hypothetical protein